MDSVISLAGSETGEKARVQSEQFELASECENGSNVFDSGHHRPSLGVSFRSLNIYSTARSTDYQKTFGNFLLVIGSQLASYFRLRRGNEAIKILSDCEGLVRSGEMLLVLGRPGSGCSTLLRSIAGQTQGLITSESSEFNYEGISAESMSSQLRGECSYLAELDIHFPTLTTSETIMVSAEARAPPAIKSQTSRKSHIRNAVTSTLRSLGLSQASDTKVGNDVVSGISGGERKRLSIAEVISCSASLQCWDNSTRGLDSVNSLQFTQTLRDETRNSNTTAIVTLYQTSDDIYKHFDKVCILYDGRVIYFGPTATGKEYFERLGFKFPATSTIAEFLTAVTNPSQRLARSGYEGCTPATAEDFYEVWKSSLERATLLEEMIEFDKLNLVGSRGLDSFNRPHLPYTITLIKQVKLCIIRGYIRLKNDLAPPLSGIIGNCILAVVLGTVFFNLTPDTDSFFSRSALIFFATLLNAFVSGFEPGMLWEQRPIVEKHYQYALYRPISDAIASMICDLPNKFLFSIFFNIPLYFLSNLHRTASAFFTFSLFSFTSLLTMSMIFRTIGSWCTTLVGSMAPAALFMLFLMIYSGFPLPTSSMQPWLRWVNYINPVGYTFESLMINEFSGRSFPCTSFVPEGPSYATIDQHSRTCNVIGAKPGSLSVNGDDYIRLSFGYLPEHLWRNFGILLGIMLFACCLHLFGATYATVKKNRGEVLLFRQGKNKDPTRGAHLKTHGERLQGDRRDTSVTLCWDRLCYDIKVGKSKKRLLDNIDGWIQRGTLTALMGESGAGKTTLLNVLANRASTGIVFGDVSIESRFATEGLAKNIGYAQQEDIHLPTATVREALQFSALLRQPKRYSRKEKLEYVEQVIESLEMENFADAIVGVPGEGLNVEQRKRLTIGVELAAKPELLLFLDEPTSGLDSDTAWAICSLLRKLADQGQAILCTIHQPSATLFGIFDKLLLLKNGRSIYFGDIGQQARTMINYFERYGADEYAVGHNPAEWLLNVTNSSSSVADWAYEWRRSLENQRVRSRVEELGQKLHKIEGIGQTQSEFSSPFITQLCTVVTRLYSHFWRTPSYLYSKAALCVGSALVIGFSFWASSNNLQGIQNEIFAVFLLMTMFTNLDQQIIPQFTSYRSIYEHREGPSKIYSWIVFLLANILVEIPWQTLMSVLIFACWYYPIGMHQNGIPTDDVGERSTLVFLFIWAFMLFTLSLSYLAVAGMDSGPTAVNIAQLLYSLSLIFCGVLARPSELPRFWMSMYRVTPLTYLVGGLLSTTLGSIPVNCSSTELVSIPIPTNLFNGSAEAACPDYLGPYIFYNGGSVMRSLSSGGCQFCPVSDTSAILERLQIRHGDRWWQLAVSFGYVLVNFLGVFTVYWVCRVRVKNKN